MADKGRTGLVLGALSPDLDGLEGVGGCDGATRGYAAGDEGAVMKISSARLRSIFMPTLGLGIYPAVVAISRE